MTIIIDAPAEVEAAIQEKAARAGLTLTEFALRALLLLEPNEAREQEDEQHQADRERAKQEVMARVRSGYYIRPGISSERLIADRREDVRREEEAWRNAGQKASLE